MIRGPRQLPPLLQAFDQAFLRYCAAFNYTAWPRNCWAGPFAGRAYTLDVSGGTLGVHAQESQSPVPEGDSPFSVSLSVDIGNLDLAEVYREQGTLGDLFIDTGVITAYENKVTLRSSARLSFDNYDAVAGILAATAESVPALFKPCRFNNKPRPKVQPTLRSLSQWTAQDLAQLRYDWSHWPAQSHNEGVWQIQAYGGSVELHRVRDRVYQRAGLIITTRMPKRGVRDYGGLFVHNLNALELDSLRIPVFGQWRETRDSLQFASLLPNAAKLIPGAADQALNWAFQRLQNGPEMIESVVRFCLRPPRDLADSELW